MQQATIPHWFARWGSPVYRYRNSIGGMHSQFAIGAGQACWISQLSCIPERMPVTLEPTQYTPAGADCSRKWPLPLAARAIPGNENKAEESLLCCCCPECLWQRGGGAVYLEHYHAINIKHYVRPLATRLGFGLRQVMGNFQESSQQWTILSFHVGQRNPIAPPASTHVIVSTQGAEC